MTSVDKCLCALTQATRVSWDHVGRTGGEMPSPKSLLTVSVSEAKSTQRVLIHNRVVCIILLSIRNPRYLTPTNSLR